MRFRSFALFVLLSCYLVSSSSLVHAGAMDMIAMQMESDSCWCEHTSDPQDMHHTSDDNTPVHDCFELCMGVYANLWWVADVKISTLSLLRQYTIPLVIAPVFKKTTSSFHWLWDDPPDLVWFGYATIWDDVKKLE